MFDKPFSRNVSSSHNVQLGKPSNTLRSATEKRQKAPSGGNRIKTCAVSSCNRAAHAPCVAVVHYTAVIAHLGYGIPRDACFQPRLQSRNVCLYIPYYTDSELLLSREARRLLDILTPSAEYYISPFLFNLLLLIIVVVILYTYCVMFVKYQTFFFVHNRRRNHCIYTCCRFHLASHFEKSLYKNDIGGICTTAV